jgi:maltooligosyltrehalose trehalohydrolase
VSRGRREEFAAFGWTGQIPDPQDAATFARSKLNWAIQSQEPHHWLWDYYQTLLRLRREHPVLGAAAKRRLEAREVDERTLAVFRRGPDGAAAFFVLNFSPDARTVRLRVPAGNWHRLLDSAEERFGDLGAKSRPFIMATRGGWVEIEMAGHGTVLYLREAAAVASQTDANGASLSGPGERAAA